MNTNRPYFLWDYDLSEDQIKGILSGNNQTDKIWLTSRILESAKYEDVWKYFNLSELKQIYPSLKLKPPIHEAWGRALSAWQ